MSPPHLPPSSTKTQPPTGWIKENLTPREWDQRALRRSQRKYTSLNLDSFAQPVTTAPPRGSLDLPKPHPFAALRPRYSRRISSQPGPGLVKIPEVEVALGLGINPAIAASGQTVRVPQFRVEGLDGRRRPRRKTFSEGSDTLRRKVRSVFIGGSKGGMVWFDEPEDEKECDEFFHSADSVLWGSIPLSRHGRREE